jgi:hypothetical protein
MNYKGCKLQEFQSSRKLKQEMDIFFHKQEQGGKLDKLDIRRLSHTIEPLINFLISEGNNFV